MRAEVLQITAVEYREDEHGNDVPCWWVVSVAVGDDRYLLDVRHIEGRYEVKGWHAQDDDTNAPLRAVALLEEDVLSEVDDYMHRGRR